MANSLSKRLERVIDVLAALNAVVRLFKWAGMCIFFLFLCYIVVDVVLRYGFNMPLPASFDIGQLTMITLVFLPIAYIQLEKAHLRVDLVTNCLPPTGRMVASTTTTIVCIAVVTILVWQSTANTLSLARIGMVSQVGGVPFYPFAALVSIGCALLLVALLRDLLSEIVEGLRVGLRRWVWFLMFGIPVLIIALFALWMQPELSGMSPAMVGVLSIVVVFLLIFLGMPVGLAMVMVSITFMSHLVGPESGLKVAGPLLFFEVGDYIWSVVPLFLLMGYFISTSGLGTDAYNTAYKWVGHYRGGLAIATAVGSAALAAVLGEPVATGITMGTMAIPEMRKHKYADSLTIGVVAAGATLGPMIPPSIGLIIYGILAEVSIGKLFIAGIIPGLLLTISFVVVIVVSCSRNPKLGPPGERSDWSDRLRSLTTGAPIALLFLIVIGGIYLGVFTAVEGGGIGAFMALIVALMMRRMTWQAFRTSLSDALRFTGVLLFVIGGAMTFGDVLAMSNLTPLMISFIERLGLSPLGFIAVILFIYLLLGLVMEAPVVLILTVPFLAPVAGHLGVDPIWFGILLVLMTNLGVITPPYGMTAFMIRAVCCPEISVGTMFRGVIPFCIASIAVCLLIVFFPALATWLPNLIW